MNTSSQRVPRLHVLTDVTLQTRYRHDELARLAIAGGADAIQLREKRPLSTRELSEQAMAVKAACRAPRAAFIVDDRVDIVAAVGADGVHLGRDDLDLATARRLLGSAALVGATANSLAEAREKFTAPIDYLGVGPIYGTRSKAVPAPTLGLESLAAIARESPVPLIAIGNIRACDVAEVMGAGAHGVAVLSGIVCANDPTAAAATYRIALDQATGTPQKRAAIRVRLNGEERSVAATVTLHQLLRETVGSESGTAVAKNGALVPRSLLSITPVSEGDVIEIVRATQGG
jgi:thiamine-phosphate pyrophosphorylase